MSKNGKSFWTTIPGILTGIASLITALVALFSFLGQEDRKGVHIPAETDTRETTPYTPTVINEGKKSETLVKKQPNILTLEIAKLVALKTHCNCDAAQIVIDQSVPPGAAYEMCYADEQRLALRKKFKNSVKIGVMVRDCGTENYWSQDTIITKDAYLNGPQTVRFKLGYGEYELTYLVK